MKNPCKTKFGYEFTNWAQEKIRGNLTCTCCEMFRHWAVGFVVISALVWPVGLFLFWLIKHV